MGGLDDEIIEDNVIAIEEKKPKRRPFHYWKVGEKEYKLKLKTSMIERVESKYGGKNILALVSDLPPLGVMLTIAQAAMAPWEHGIGYQDIQALYDQWTDEGGSQMEFYTSVVMPTLEVSGFFTAAQAASMTAALKEMDELT